MWHVSRSEGQTVSKRRCSITVCFWLLCAHGGGGGGGFDGDDDMEGCLAGSMITTLSPRC